VICHCDADLPIFWLGAVVHHHTCATTTSLRRSSRAPIASIIT
jgi:hypothetical protein